MSDEKEFGGVRAASDAGREPQIVDNDLMVAEGIADLFSRDVAHGLNLPGVARLLRRMIEALRASRAPAEPPAHTSWLVALGSMPPRWWTGRGDEWTTDVDGTQRNPACAAMRFARREDAERAIGWLVKEGVKEGCRAEEHIWL